MKKIVIADREADKMGVMDLLEGYEVATPYGYCSEENELIDMARDAEAIITVLGKVSKKVIDSANNLKIIAVAAAGYDNVDVSAASSNKVFVTRAAIANVEGIAEHALMFMIMLSKKGHVAFGNVKEGNWAFRNTSQAMGKEITGKTLGIIGLGKIGTALAKKTLCLGMEVLVYDPWISPGTVDESGINLVTLQELLQHSDYVCVTCALTENTYHMIGNKELQIMKSTAYLTNVSRGGIVDENSLYKALAEEWIAGAALDVLEEEPPSRPPRLLELKNCIITPHIAGLTTERYLDCGRVAIEDVKNVLNGGTPRAENLINPEIIR